VSEATLDRLAGDWRIWQLRRGHRFSSDDLFTAWLAGCECPTARRACDLGSGIGSVGLLTLWQLAPEATLVCVEAQELSAGLLRRTLATNGLQQRVESRVGDLRDVGVVPEKRAFDLVTGSPPYIPLGKGVVSPNPQRAAARMELRGSIHDYARTAARILAPGGAFVVCFAAADPRGEQALDEAGLHLHVRQDVVFRAPEPPLITVMLARHEPGPCQRREPVVIRGPDGAWTERYLAIRRAMGAPDGSTRPAPR
jgi:tRNA1(Val) A37 N6-methylase TrmN6